MKQWRIMTVVSVIGAVMFLSGCAASQNLVGKELTKETVPNSKTYFSQVWAVEDDKEFRVSGKLRLKGSLGFNVPDFVEVAMVDAGGKIIEKQKVVYTPRILTGRRKHREARFTARFNQAPPAG
ncbi:MAG: hypothetical protein ABR605_04545, partial [Desulfurivibrionaceae bacterium]